MSLPKKFSPQILKSYLAAYLGKTWLNQTILLSNKSSTPKDQPSA
jgi:hypothetical protein